MMPAIGANPYPGLRAFEPRESDLFFGRERETDDLRRLLRTNRLLAVVGSSGTGKSSLVRSGLIPSLHAGFMSGASSSWRIALTRPGEDPIGNLAVELEKAAVLGEPDAHPDTRRTMLEANLRDSSLGLAAAVRHARLPAGDNVLIVIDQFEELFRFWRSRRRHRSGDDAAAFVKLLLEAARSADLPIYVVLTMRSEYIGECMAFTGLPEAINAGQYLIPAMSRDALRAAISGPAAVRGAAIAPRLMVRLLNEVGNDRDRLPVLQHALMRTWDAWAKEDRVDQPLDVPHYEAIGTMREALSRHAEEAYAELDGAAEQACAERVFKALTETTEQGLGVRREQVFGALTGVCNATPTELAKIIDRFRSPGRAFLQPPAGVPLLPDTIVDISHESLMRLWTRLARWVEEEARSTEIYRRLVRAAAQYEAGEASLWRPPELSLGLRWLRENQPTAAWAGDAAAFDRATSFLQLSRRAHGLRVGIAALLVAAVIGGLAFYGQQQRRVKESLQAKVTTLTDARDAASQARGTETREVQELRTENASLKAAVAAEQQTRSQAEATLATLRDSVRDLQSRIERVNAENSLLQERVDLLNEVFSRLDAEAKNLEASLSRLEPVPARVEGQVKLLDAQVNVEQARNGVLRALVRETQPCPTASMRPSPVGAAPPPETSAGERTTSSSSGSAGARPPRVSASIPDMRRRIDELARELEALQNERARLQDEALYLGKENALLTEQQAALQTENRRLEQLRAELEDQQTRLQAKAADADSRHAALLAQSAAGESRNSTALARVRTLGTTRENLEARTVQAVDLLDQTQRRLESLRAENERLAAVMMPHVERLLQAARSAEQPPDLAALLAVKAQRWSPYDTDDAAHPSVYNTLWTVLRRLDEPAALSLVAPRESAGGKIGTTSTASLVEALCRQVSRPLTEAEWRRFAPARACFVPEAAQPCRR